MRTNAEGIALIKKAEGLRLKAYLDGGGVPTIGWGHTSNAGAPVVKLGMTITAEEAEAIFKKDVENVEKQVAALLKVDLNDNQFSACVSLCYNIGAGNFAKSSVLRFINQNRFQDAADAFALWNRDDGKIVGGLVKRRAAEAALFVKEDGITEAPPRVVEAATGKPLSLSTTNVAAGVAAVATVSASAKEIATNATAVFSGQNIIGVVAIIVLVALGWIVYQRYRHHRDWGI